MPASLSYPVENVLCVPTRDLYDATGKWRGLRKDSPEVWRPIAKKAVFKPRVDVEQDPSFKQLISYTMFISERRVFVMKRLNTQSEERLRGLLSIGVGGHMNPVSEVPWPGKRRMSDLRAIVTANTAREIREEVSIAGNPSISIIGFLNDDENPVGQVHLGVVSVVHLSSPLLAVKEIDKMMGAWVELSNLKTLGTFETWSALLLSGLS